MRIEFKNPFLKLVIRVCESIHEWLERRRVRVYAAQASFFITISALPFLILVLTLAGTLMPREGSMIKEAILDVIPSEFAGLAETLLREVSEKSNMQLLSVSAVTLLWSASRGIRGIGAGIRNVYGGRRDGDLVRYTVKAVLYTLLWMLTVIMTLVIWVFGDAILSHTPSGGLYGLLRVLNSGAFLIILTGVFALTYKGYAGRKVRYFQQLPGALFSAVAWFLYSRFFEFYIENFADYSYIYGSITSLIIVMLWLYACMEILLIGAGINALAEDKPAPTGRALPPPRRRSESGTLPERTTRESAVPPTDPKPRSRRRRSKSRLRCDGGGFSVILLSGMRGRLSGRERKGRTAPYDLGSLFFR